MYPNIVAVVIIIIIIIIIIYLFIGNLSNEC